MIYKLSDQQNKAINDWLYNECFPKTIEQQKLDILEPDEFVQLCWDAGEPYSGAIGGGITITFTPTSIGVITTVIYRKNTPDEMELDITDYETW